MNYRLVETEKGKYIELVPGEAIIVTAQDAVDLVGIAYGSDVDSLLIPTGCLSDDFVVLSTGFAGLVVQKLVQYRIRTAIVLEQRNLPERFQEYAREINNTGSLHICFDEEEARAWLIA